MRNGDAFQSRRQAPSAAPISVGDITSRCRRARRQYAHFSTDAGFAISKHLTLHDDDSVDDIFISTASGNAGLIASLRGRYGEYRSCRKTRLDMAFAISDMLARQLITPRIFRDVYTPRRQSLAILMTTPYATLYSPPRPRLSR